MKIAILSFYSGGINRGIETFVEELEKGLQKKHQVTVFRGKGTDFAKFSSGWRLYLDNQSMAIKRFTQGVLAKLDKDTNIVIATNGGWQSLLCRWWCWRNGAKLIISGQSGPGWDDRTNLFCRPDAFVALTDFQANWAKENGLGVKIAKIPNGVNLSEFSPNVKPVKIDLPHPIILSVAALESDKRLDLTVNAVAKLSGASLLTIGTGKLKEQLETMAAKLLRDRFQIISVPHPKIPTYYAAADLVTMAPPLTESFGIIFLEGMAANKPVVTTDDPPRREIVGDAGLFVDPENTLEYAAALQKALDTNWGDKPRKQAEKFSWDEIAKKYDQLFHNLTGL